MNRAKLASLAAKASQLLSEWTEAERATVLLLGNFGNVLQRLQEIGKPKHYDGVLPGALDLSELQRRVSAKQLSTLATVLDRLHATMNDLVEVVRMQEKLCVEAWAALGPNPPAASCATVVSGLATPAQLVEAMEDAWFMCRDELCLKQAVVCRLHLAMSNEEFGELCTLFGTSININKASPSYLLLKTQAFTS